MSIATSHVFISYSRRDTEAMQRIVAHLRGQGIKAWVDNERLVPGTPIWEEEIEKAIKGAFAIVVVLSPDAKKSEWVRREITLAEQFQKRLFPVLVNGDADDSIPLRLITNQYVNLKKNEPAGLEALSTAVQRYLNDLIRIEEIKKAEEEAERQHLVAQKAEEERLAKARLEAERLAEEKRLADQAEKERQAKAEAKRLAVEKVEAVRLAAQKAEEERIAKAKLDAEQLAEEKTKQEQIIKTHLGEERRSEEKRPANVNSLKGQKSVALGNNSFLPKADRVSKTLVNSKLPFQPTRRWVFFATSLVFLIVAGLLGQTALQQSKSATTIAETQMANTSIANISKTQNSQLALTNTAIAEATNNEAARLAKTSISQSTSTASALATASYFETLNNSATLVLEPKNGRLAAMSAVTTKVQSGNVIMEVTISNPFEYFVFGFRKGSNFEGFNFAVTYDSNEWDLQLYTLPKIFAIQAGRLILDKSEGGSNTFKLYCINGKGYFYANGKFISQLDLSLKLIPGNVVLSTSDQTSLNYNNYKVWEIR